MPEVDKEGKEKVPCIFDMFGTVANQSLSLTSFPGYGQAHAEKCQQYIGGLARFHSLALR